MAKRSVPSLLMKPDKLLYKSVCAVCLGFRTLRQMLSIPCNGISDRLLIRGGMLPKCLLEFAGVYDVGLSGPLKMCKLSDMIKKAISHSKQEKRNTSWMIMPDPI